MKRKKKHPEKHMKGQELHRFVETFLEQGGQIQRLPDQIVSQQQWVKSKWVFTEWEGGVFHAFGN